jgi:hypothetical protein
MIDGNFFPKPFAFWSGINIEQQAKFRKQIDRVLIWSMVSKTIVSWRDSEN